MKYIWISAFCLVLASCAQKSGITHMDALKQEVLDAEQRFALMAADSGIEAAFIRFAAPEAVMKRGNRLVSGRDSIIAYMEKERQPGVKLTWDADFVDVSESGDLAYTFGRYIYTFPDSSGAIKQQEGIFHTVWKRQPDRKWKFVWD